MTALALLIAIFPVSAEPFCILDEVDAPLTKRTWALNAAGRGDERPDTIIIVTHNRKTMETGSVLYGVTMQERRVEAGERAVGRRGSAHAKAQRGATASAA